MRSDLLPCAAALAALLVAGSASAQVRSLPFRLVRAGVPLKISAISSVNPDCTSRGYAEVRLLAAPAGGQVTITRTRDYPALPASDPAFACDRRRVPAVDVFYRPFRGFRGADTVDLEMIFPDGVVRHGHYALEVE